MKTGWSLGGHFSALGGPFCFPGGLFWAPGVHFGHQLALEGMLFNHVGEAWPNMVGTQRVIMTNERPMGAIWPTSCDIFHIIAL